MIQSPPTSRALFSTFGRLFDYREAASVRDVIEALLAGIDDRHATAAAHLQQFRDEVAAFDRRQLEELYTRTFDLNPSCTLYLSVHLFGEESFKRAILMTGLAGTYERAGLDRGGELPDHLGIILRFAACFTDEEWEDMARFCLPTPLVRMRALLDPSRNPYRHVVAALQAFLGAEFPMETVSCSISSSSVRSLTSPCSSCSLGPSGDTSATASATPPCPLNSSRTGNSSGVPSPGMSESW